MNIKFDFSTLAKTKWYEYAIRFLFGGATTVAAGLLAKEFGPVFGGLFLAFPAILPASATLIEKHEREKKRQAGVHVGTRGRDAAAIDARGAAMGSLGLVCFAAFVWKLLPLGNASAVLVAALAVWFGSSFLIWRISNIH